MVPITTHMIVPSINISVEDLHNRRWTKMLHFKKPLHSNNKMSNFPETNVTKFYIDGNLYIIFIHHALLKADWF